MIELLDEQSFYTGTGASALTTEQGATLLSNPLVVGQSELEWVGTIWEESSCRFASIA